MSWTDELYKIYENNYGRSESGEKMLPISHSTANAQIEVTITEQGDFVEARELDKSEAVTIIPVTEASGSRSSGIAPMPLADKLIYIAGDFSRFAVGKHTENSDYFSAYMEQLKDWSESDNSHEAVRAVYSYLKKACIMKDLIDCGVLTIDGETGKLDNRKISGFSQQDAFVRFRVNYYKDIMHENQTWKDSTLYDSFIAYNRGIMGNNQLCYATGENLPCTYKHPSKIRNAGDKAKLISANDESGFTYRGRFSDKEEAISVSYDFSQKMHNALKWLIARQGMSIENSLMLVVWASALEPIPDIRKSFSDCLDDLFPNEENIVPDTESIYKSQLEKMIFGYMKNLKINSKVMIMGLDAATTGRLSIAMYSELEGSRFFENIKKWHSDISWIRFDYKQKCNSVNSFSLYEIAKCAYGTEQNGELKCKSEILTDTVLRLIPCITEGRKLPKDIMRSLFVRASNPLAYEKGYNHRLVLETACGIIRKYYLDNGKGVISMAIDYKDKPRSYLFGCLLAIADKAESDTYEKEERGKRITNVKRYWNKFVSYPYRTWGIIESRLRPYLNKLGPKAIKYEKLMQTIMTELGVEGFSSPKGLEPLYLLGYHVQLKELYPLKNENNIENNEEE